jgi:hypothetical protein
MQDHSAYFLSLQSVLQRQSWYRRNSIHFNTMSGSEISIRGSHFLYAPLRDGFVLSLACLVTESCVGGLIEGASDDFTYAMDALHGALDVVANVAACVGHY